jgi:hypothetical protein
LTNHQKNFDSDNTTWSKFSLTKFLMENFEWHFEEAN